MRKVFTAITLVLLALLSGCGGEVSTTAGPPAPVGPSSTVFVDELAVHDGRVCPKRLPTGADPYGFGTDELAVAAPAIAVPDQGWVCLYSPVEGPRQPNGDAFFKWVREGGPHIVGDSQLFDLAAMVDNLVPPVRSDEQNICTMDLGPRWMLVLSTQGDLTGVVVNDYGCNEVRLTDEPFETALGEAEPVGTVPGVLSGPNVDLLRGLQSAYGPVTRY